MLKIFILLFISFGGTLAGNIESSSCGTDGSVNLIYLDVEGCSGNEPCVFRAGHSYTATFKACTARDLGVTVSEIPYSLTAEFIPNSELLAYTVVSSANLCDSFTPDSPTTSCPAQASSGTCAIFRIVIQAPLFQLVNLPIAGIPGDLVARVGVNSLDNTVICIKFPISYKVLL